MTISSAQLRMGALFATCLAVFGLYWESLFSMVGLWDVQRYQHAYLVPLLSLYLFWMRREAFSIPWKGSWIGLFGLSACVLVWLVAQATFVQAIEHIALLLILNTAVWAVAGWRVYQMLALPLLFLVFALPIGGGIVPYLMRFTADVSSLGLNVIGVPVYREGMVLTLPGGTFEVADVCSGIRYLNSGLTLGVLTAFMFFQKWWKRLVYLPALVGIYILTNGVRAFIVMAVASATDMEYLGGVDHIYFGWVLFLAVMVFMIWIAQRYADT